MSITSYSLYCRLAQSKKCIYCNWLFDFHYAVFQFTVSWESNWTVWRFASCTSPSPLFFFVLLDVIEDREPDHRQHQWCPPALGTSGVQPLCGASVLGECLYATVNSVMDGWTRFKLVALTKGSKEKRFKKECPTLWSWSKTVPLCCQQVVLCFLHSDSLK